MDCPTRCRAKVTVAADWKRLFNRCPHEYFRALHYDIKQKPDYEALMTTMTVEADSPVEPRRTAAINRGKRAGDNLKSVLIGVHCTPKMVAQIERFISTLEYDEMTRPEAIRLILKRYLKEKGFE